MAHDPIEFKLACETIESVLVFSSADPAERPWMQAFIQQINDLILNDFNKLILILYRLDISESKLTSLLKVQSPGNGMNTAEIICHLIIERQIEKIKSRKQYGKENQISEEEKW